jgi:hypothetical protein
MKGLLIVLTVVAMVAAVFLGGCAIVGILDNAANAVRDPGELQYGGLYRTIVVMSAFGLLLAVTLVVANILVLYGLFRGATRRSRLAAGVLAVFDVVVAAGALAWLVWADTWHWANVPWTRLAKGACGVLALKGILIWRLGGRRGTADAVSVGEP